MLASRQWNHRPFLHASDSSANAELTHGPNDSAPVTSWTWRPSGCADERSQADAASGTGLITRYEEFGGFGIHMQQPDRVSPSEQFNWNDVAAEQELNDSQS